MIYIEQLSVQMQGKDTALNQHLTKKDGEEIMEEERITLRLTERK